jgi:hypothetical protein
LAFMAPLGKATPETTTVFVDPKENSVKLGQTFPINISITDVSGLLGFDFCLSYDTTVLTLVDVQEGPFLKSVGNTFTINLTTTGLIWLAVTLYYPKEQPVSANGSGVLATATFKSTAAGESSLNLFSKDWKCGQIKLASDPPPDNVAEIPNVAISGHVVISSDPLDPPPDPPTNPDPPNGTIPGDVSSNLPGTPDGAVDMKDIAYLTSLFNTKPTSPNWNQNADINNDSMVNMRDIGIAIQNFGAHENSDYTLFGTLTYANVSAVYVGVTAQSIAPNLFPSSVGSFMFLIFSGQTSRTVFPTGFVAGNVVELSGTISFDTHSQTYAMNVNSITHVI